MPQLKNPCGSFFWKDLLSLGDKFIELNNVKACAGETIRIWKDNWMSIEEFPHLFSFSKNQDISLKKFIELSEEDIYEQFHLPLSIIASRECEEFSLILQNQENIDSENQWNFNSKRKYSCNFFMES